MSKIAKLRKAPATTDASPDVSTHARLSGGSSDSVIYQTVETIIRTFPGQSGTLADVGCGSGTLWKYVNDLFARYVGIDLVRYSSFPSDGELRLADLNAAAIPLSTGSVDVVAAIEIIEHLENPRAFVRELARIAKPGGWVVLTTPNQLSFLSKLTLLLKNQFNAFQQAPGLYPAHLTALLEADLIRIATECGLTNVRVTYTNRGRIPFTGRQWPPFCKGRAFSDNVVLVANKSLVL